MRTALLLVTMSLLVLVCSLPVLAQTNWEVEKILKIGGEGAWDYLTVDPDAHRLFVPRTTHTMVIDADSGKILGDIPGQKVAHGVAIVPEVAIVRLVPDQSFRQRVEEAVPKDAFDELALVR
jgi:hypothetical protein